MSVIPESVDHWATISPDSPALRLGNEVLSYQQLQARANGLAAGLVGLGVKRGDRVGLFLHKSIETAVGAYGIMKAGAAFVPLDPLMPPKRLRSIMTDCGIEVVVTESSKLELLLGIASGTALKAIVGPARPARMGALAQASGERVEWLSWSEVAATAVPSVGVESQPDDLAYIMYTSGSTGEPKGMMHSHRSGLAFAQWGVDFCDLGPSDRVASHGPLHFDISIFDFFSSALAGSCVELIPEPVTKFPASLSKFLADQQVTVLFTVPYALSQLAINGALAERQLGYLRWILFGGEPFAPQQLAALMSAFPEASFGNVFGPAEAPACVNHVVSERPGAEAPIPIGTPAPGTEIRIVEPGGTEPVANGEIGELLVAAESVTQGYWNQPDRNRASFVELPARRSIDPERQRFFRTGDLVRKHIGATGSHLLFFHGRNDRMVKSRGFRIELDEIEAVLLGHESVEAAAVFMAMGEGEVNLVHGVYILATSAADPEGWLSNEEIMSYLGERLPRYALPATLTKRLSFPLTTSGKIDRRALSAASRNLP